MTTQWHPWLFDGPPLSSGLFTQFLHRRVYVVNRDPGPHSLRPLSRQMLGKDATRLEPPAFVTVERAIDRESGYVLVGALEPASADDDAEKDDAEKRGTRVFRVFVRGTLASSARSTDGICITGLPLEATSGMERLESPPASQRLDSGPLTLVRSGTGWALYEGSFSRAADVATVALNSGAAVGGKEDSPRLVHAGPLASSSQLAKELP